MPDRDEENIRSLRRALDAFSRGDFDAAMEMAHPTWAVWTLDDDGLITRVEGFLIHQESEAREAAGLSE